MALMKDQVKAMTDRGTSAVYVGSPTMFSDDV